MIEKWISENLNTVESMIDENILAIKWSNGDFTDVPVFLDMFGDVIEQALKENKDVRQAIADNDNGRGYKKLILN